MYFLLIIMSVVLGALGLLLLLSPKTALALNQVGNKVILSEKKILEHRYISGIVSLAFAVFFIVKAASFDPMSSSILKLPFYILGSLMGLFGLAFLFSPKYFEKVNEWTSKEMVDDSFMLSHPRGAGIFLLVAAVLLWYSSTFYR